ncbi:purine-cytosine permease family protein [Bacillus piscicola]|uniref:purine-cytosine permease family protein n=1 Tax=Bacillus piscicola TaxID=1632684 RepID=UPI001F096588|nr:cytosine permease [Bacillus piscicola]
MGENNNTSSIENKSYEYIPLEERGGSPRQFFFTWFAANTVSTTLVTGALAIIVGLNFWWGSLALILGNSFGAVITSLHSAQGPKIGTPQMVQSRAQFGYYGVALPMIIAFIMYVGYGSTNTVLVGQGINETLGINLNAVIIIAMVPMVLLAIYGQGIIERSMKIYTIFYAAVFLVLNIIVISQLSMEVLNKGSFSFGQFLLVISLGITWQITYGPYVSDHSRYMHPDNAKRTFLYTYLGINLSSTWLMILGAAVATMTVNGNVMAQIKDLGSSFGSLIVILLALGLIVVNSLNIYGAGIIALSIASNFIKFQTTIKLRVITSAVIGALIVLFSTVGANNFMSNFQIYLGFILFFIIPWSVITLTDFYILKHTNYDPRELMEKDGIFGKLNKSTLIIYLLTVMCQIPFINTEIYQGPVSKMIGGTDVAWLVGIVIGFSLYFVWSKITTDSPALKKASNIDFS